MACAWGRPERTSSLMLREMVPLELPSSSGTAPPPAPPWDVQRPAQELELPARCVLTVARFGVVAEPTHLLRPCQIVNLSGGERAGEWMWHQNGSATKAA